MTQRESFQSFLEAARPRLTALHRAGLDAEGPATMSGELLSEIYAVVEELVNAEEQVRELGREQVAREVAEAAQAQLDAVLQHLPMGIVIAEAPTGRIMRYNQAVEELTGGPPPLADSLEEYEALYRLRRSDGSTLAVQDWPLVRALTGRETRAVDEMEVRCVDGTWRVVRMTAAPIRDADGEVRMAVMIMDDITVEKRRVEIQRFLGEVSDVLSTSLDYRTTVQGIAGLCARGLGECCIVHVERDGHVRGLGIAHADSGQEKVIREFLRRTELDPNSSHPVIEVLRTGSPRIYPVVTDDALARMVTAGEQLDMLRTMGISSMLVVPLFARGRTFGAISVARTGAAPSFDRSDQALAMEVARRAAHAMDNARLYLEAQRAARTRDEILGVVSHDLRNALNAALMNADLLLEIEPIFEPESRGRHQMEAIRRSLDYMHRLVKDLLEADRISRGSLPIERILLQPAMLVTEIAELFGTTAREASITLETRVPDGIPPISADHARMVQVLANLVGNALRATPSGGRITVEAEAEAGNSRVCFRVRDTGVGIPEEYIPHVFERFFRGATGDPRGSGLGLAISKGIVEAHGGRMTVESQVNHGSVFSFSLPAA